MESILLHTFPTTNITSQSFLLTPVEEAGETFISEWRLLSLAPLASCWSEHSSLGASSVRVCVHMHVLPKDQSERADWGAVMTGGNDFSPLESRERDELTGERGLLSEGPALSPEWTGRAGRGNERETSVERRRPSPWNKQSTCFLEESREVISSRNQCIPSPHPLLFLTASSSELASSYAVGGCGHMSTFPGGRTQINMYFDVS